MWSTLCAIENYNRTIGKAKKMSIRSVVMFDFDETSFDQGTTDSVAFVSSHSLVSNVTLSDATALEKEIARQMAVALKLWFDPTKVGSNDAADARNDAISIQNKYATRVLSFETFSSRQRQREAEDRRRT